MSEGIHKPLFSVAGLVIIAVLLLAVIALSSTVLRGMRLDLTENKLYTLSEGSHSILSKIDEPIHLYLFYSREIAQGLPSISNYAQRVREVLSEMAEVAGGKLKLTVVDPEPFSEQEDRAVQLGIQTVPLSGTDGNLYFGLAATNAVGETAVIPYFSSDRASLLEYDLSKLVYELNQTKKSVIGLLSTLPMHAGIDPRRMQATPAWVVVEQLRQFFEVRKLENDIATVPDDIDLLVLVHPAGLEDGTLYAIDQFVLSGGKALVFVDPYAESAQAGGLPDQSTSPQSDLKPLLAAWGARLHDSEILGDARYALRVSTDPSEAPTRHYAILSVPQNTMNQDDVITRGLERVNIALGGILEPIEGASTEFVPLIRSSNSAMPLPSFRIQPQLDPSELQRGFQPTGKQYVLAARITGKANSAFPEGPPASEDEDTADQTAAEKAAEEPGEDKAVTERSNKAHVAESAEPINVVVIADTDVLTDRLWVGLERFFGRQIAVPFADNGDLVINAVDNLLGSSDLISIRSRASYARPFERVDQLRLEAESRLRAKEQALQTRLQATERQLAELQSKKGEAGHAIILSAEQQAAINGFQQEVLNTRKELRGVRHELNKSIENLGTALKFINIVLVPLLLTIGVIIFTVVRHKRASAALLNPDTAQGRPG